MATSITQHGITVTFTPDSTVGTYVDGSSYIVAASGISVTEITVGTGDHVAGSVVDRDGAMINPNPLLTFGYDGRGVDGAGAGYDATKNKTASYPFTVMAGQSLVCTESALTPRNYHGTANPIFLETAIVVNVVASAPAANSFRPHPYSGTKTTYTWAQVNQANLKAHAGTAATMTVAALIDESGTPGAGNYRPDYSRFQLECGVGYTARRLHPYRNMRDYGQYIALCYGEMLLHCHNDAADLTGDRDDLVKAVIQIGIDHYGFLLSGGYFPADGGHGLGRKAMVVIAGDLLGVATMENIGTTKRFQEDEQTFYVSQADVDRTLVCEFTGTVVSATPNSIVLSTTPNVQMVGNDISITSGTGNGQTRTISSSNGTEHILTAVWTTTPAANDEFTTIGYEAGDLGTAEWGKLHTTNPTVDNPSLNADYRELNSWSYGGLALAVAASGLQNAYAWPAFFDYVNRWRVTLSKPFQGSTVTEQQFDANWATHYVAGNVPRLSARAVPR